MRDLDSIQGMFAALEGCSGRYDDGEQDFRETDFYRSSLDYKRSFVDSHRAADAFIAADETTREAIRAAAKEGRALPLPARRSSVRFSDSLRAKARRLRATGLSLRAVAKQCGTSHFFVIQATKAAA